MSDDRYARVPTVADGAARLAAHATECDECRQAPLPMDRIAIYLSSMPLDVDAAGMSARAFVRLRRELKAIQAVPWRRVLLGLLRALLPLPAVLALDAYLLWTAYALGSTVLPAALVGYLLFSYAAWVVLLFALTYAAVPLVMARQTLRWKDL